MPPSAPQRDETSFLRGFLRMLTRFVTRRARFTLWIIAIVSIVAIGLSVREMGIRTRRADLIDPKTDLHKDWKRYTETFGEESEIIVAIESERSELIERALDDLGSRMEGETQAFAHVVYKGDASNLRGKGLQSFSPAELNAGLARLRDYDPLLQGRWDLLKLDSLIDRLRNQISARSQSNSRDAAAPLWRHAELLSTSLANNFENPDDFQSPWPQLLPADRLMRSSGGRRVHCLNDECKIGYIKALPVQEQGSLTGASTSISRLRELIAEVTPEHPDVQFGITGIPALENDEMQRSQVDILFALGIAFVGVTVVLFFGFRGWRHPLLAIIMLLAGMSWAAGYATLVVGHLNVLSIGFACVLIGIGIDYAIHYLARYIELRLEGEDLRPALLKTSTSRGAGILTSALTTALAFFAATFTEFLGIAELGIIAGGSIVICALATFLVLPPLLAISDRSVEVRNIPTPFQADYLRRMIGRFPRTVMIVSLLLVVGLSLQIVRFRAWRVESRIRYDYNTARLQADDTESVRVLDRMFEKTNDSLLYAVSVADSADQARALRRKLEALPTVHHVEDLASRLPSASVEQSRQLMQTYRSKLASLPRTPVRVANPDPARVGRSLEELYKLARQSTDPRAGKVERVLNSFLDKFANSLLPDQTKFLSRYQQRAVGSIHSQFVAMAEGTNTEPIRASDVPETLKTRFRSSDGKWLLQIYPKEQIWDQEPLGRFVADVRSVDPNVTGVPLQNFESARQIRRSYTDASIYALAVICVVLLFDFLEPKHKLLALVVPLAVIGFAVFTLHARRSEISYVTLALTFVGMTAAISAFLDFRQFRDMLLALSPALAGGGLLFGILALMGSHLNPANLIVLPMLLGVGVANGVHMLHDFRGQVEGKYATSASTVNGIVLSSLTTMVGFGSLMVAGHRGLRSVGIVLSIGMACCLFVSLVLLPAILTVIAGRRSAGKEGGKRTESGEARGSSAAAARAPQRKAA